MEKLPIVQIDTKYAILIGINSYLDDIISTLSYSVADVKSFYDVFIDPNRGNYNQRNIKILTDESSNPDFTPIRSNIMSQISSLASMATTKDSILLYFSGHGIEKNGQSFLLPQDARYNILDETAISIKWLNETLISSNARVKVIIFDACHSGAIKGKEVSGYMTKGFEKSILPAPEGFAILSSCKANEVSWENDEMKHSVFSYFLLEGLSGNADYDQDSKITIMEANKYTFEKVTSWGLANSKIQSPHIKCTLYGEVVLCQVPSDYVPPSPTEIEITSIRLSSELMKKKESSIVIGKLCGFLLNHIKADTILAKSEDETEFHGGRILRKKSKIRAKYYFDLFFNYDKEIRQIVDTIISALDDSGILKFDEIEFLFSSKLNLTNVLTSCKKRGFKISSYDPVTKNVEIELSIELKEEFTTVSLDRKDEGSTILFKNKPDYFNENFYDRINPKSVMDFFIIVQK